MQWNGVRPNPDRPAPLRSLMEILQQKAEPYVTQYGENQIPGAGQLLNSIMRTGTEMVPGVGDLLGAEDLQTAAQNNDWAGIGLGALAAIPGIPAIGRGVRGEARAARGVANTVADAVPTNQPMSEAEAALARYRAAYPDATGARVLNPGDEGYPTNAQWDEASQTYVAPVEPDYPIRAFHGSPHSFDRFSLDKIGTGEGAQAYGHGLYFAESEDVARGYRDALQQSLLSLGGDIVTDNPRIARLAKAYPSADSAIQGVRGQLARAENTLATSTDDLDRMIAEADINEARTTLAELEPYAGQWFDKTPTGSMYEVGINADPAAFLDYDAPLSRQPENVRRVLGYQGNLPPPPDREIAAIIRTAMRQAEGDASQVGMIVDNDYGLYQRALEHARQQGVEADSAGDYIDSVASDYLRQLSLRDARADDLRSLYMGREQELLDAGVPGVRYRDGFSRGNETADSPTSNYVLFNDDLVKILRKYGIGGLSTTVGASALAEELDRRGQTQEF